MSHRSRHAAWIAALALAGLALAVGLAFLASRLSAQHIGLAGESPGAGATLVTRTATAESRPRPARRRPPPKPKRTSTTPTPPVAASPAPVTRTSETQEERGERRHDGDD
jgi:hypothetical protein